MAIAFLAEYSANWSRKSSLEGSQRCRAVLGIALEVREVERLFAFSWPSSQRSYPILGTPCLAKEKSNLH